MNKADLTNWVANRTGMTKKDVTTALDAIIEGIMATVKSGDTLTLTNFGTFVSVSRKASNKRNPKTGAPVKVPAKRVPRFRPGKQFRDMVK